MAYISVWDKFFPKPTKEELAAEKARKREEAQKRKVREKKRALFQKACAYEESGDIIKAIRCYEKVIDNAKDLRIDEMLRKSLNKLIRFYRKDNNVDEEKRILRIGIDWNEDVLRLKARLDFLESNQSTGTLPTKRISITLQEQPKGYKYQEMRKNMIEKYWSKHNCGYVPSEVEQRESDEFFNFSATFQETFNQAEAAEAGNNYIEAARLYETLVANRFYSCMAYDRLMVIYNKAKLYDVVEEVLEEAISQAQQNVFSQNDESKLIKRWGERLKNLRERRKARLEKVENTESKVSPELEEMQKRFHTIESEYGKILITLVEDEVWFNGRDVCHAIGYTDPKRPMQTHCRNAIMLKYPIMGTNGKLTSRTGKFIQMKDVQRMIVAYGTFASEEKTKRLHLLQEWLMEAEKEYTKKCRGVVNVTIDNEALAELEKQTQESQSILSDIFKEETDVAASVTPQIDNVKSLLATLLTKEIWEKSEVEKICDEKGIKYNVALEQINDYAYSIMEDGVVEEDGNKVYVTTDYKKNLL